MRRRLSTKVSGRGEQAEEMKWKVSPARGQPREPEGISGLGNLLLLLVIVQNRAAKKVIEVASRSHQKSSIAVIIKLLVLRA